MLLVYPLCRRVQQRLVTAVPPAYREAAAEVPSAARPASHA